MKDFPPPPPKKKVRRKDNFCERRKGRKKKNYIRVSKQKEQLNTCTEIKENRAKETHKILAQKVTVDEGKKEEFLKPMFWKTKKKG